MDTTKATTHVSLCAGYGGIDIGLSRAIPSLRTVAFSEIEAFACANLVSKMEAGLLDAAPIWTNLKTFPWSGFRDRVDILSGGYPCQPFSAAGKRLGTEDPRHLWPFIADGIRTMRPRVCFFENVEGHISLGLREVISELESIGYKVAWGIFSAREVGAPHQRKRVFILAYDKSLGIQGCGADWLQESLAHVGQAIPMCGGEGCKLADTSYGTDTASGHAETHRLPSEYREAVYSGESGGANADAWPSRPGQPQYGWEPPRVVANSNSLRLEGWKGKLQKSERGNNVIHASISSERYVPMGDTQHDGSHQRGSQTRGAESCSEQGRMQELERGSASMGNTEGWQDHGRESRDLAEESRCGTGGDHAADCTGEVLADDLRGRLSHATDQQRNSGAEDHAVIRTRPTESGWRQTQPPLGGDTDGSAGGLDYAELCITCDNRTDELRLLGNGVVPATAERAFRTLLAELIP